LEKKPPPRSPIPLCRRRLSGPPLVNVGARSSPRSRRSRKWAVLSGDSCWQTLVYIGIFLAGLLTVGQFSFWGNYLPRVYPLHLRGTGESFAANIGGRMIGTSFAWVTQTLATTNFMPGEGEAKLSYTAAIVGTTVYVVGLILSFFLPEPPPELEDA